jgi:hypothetical protein
MVSLSQRRWKVVGEEASVTRVSSFGSGVEDNP